VFAFGAVAFLALAVLWPPVVAEMVRSGWVPLVMAVRSIGLAILLHPEVSSGLARGFREFRKALEEVTEEIGGDDDDGPRAP